MVDICIYLQKRLFVVFAGFFDESIRDTVLLINYIRIHFLTLLL